MPRPLQALQLQGEAHKIGYVLAGWRHNYVAVWIKFQPINRLVSIRKTLALCRYCIVYRIFKLAYLFNQTSMWWLNDKVSKKTAKAALPESDVTKTGYSITGLFVYN